MNAMVTTLLLSLFLMAALFVPACLLLAAGS